MTALRFGLGSYARSDDRLPQSRLVNFYAEQTPTTTTGVALIQRPGLAPLYTPAGDCRGFYQQDGVLNGDLFAVYGEKIYREGVLVDDVPGEGLVEWGFNSDGLHVLSEGVIYNTADGNTWAVDAFPDSANVASITAINGILLAVRADTGTVYFKLPGDTAWAALDYFDAEREPDPALAVRGVADELWVLGSTSVEIFAPTGEVDVPFQRIGGRAIQRGIKTRDSAANLDNTLFWVGEDNIVYRADGVPVRVSNHGIEEQISNSSACSAWTYVAAGHTFYVMTLDTETQVFDVATGEWHQAKLFGSDTFVTTGLFTGSQTFVGIANKICTLTDRADDDGDPMERIFTAYAPTQKPGRCDAVEFQVSPGTAPIGQECFIQMRWSDDEGRTWSAWRTTSLGTEGSYRTRARFRRLGMIDAPGRVFEGRVADPAVIRVSGVEMNPPLGGRSR